MRSPITLTLLQNDAKFEKAFSLDLEDSEASQFVHEFVSNNPRRLHELVPGPGAPATHRGVSEPVSGASEKGCESHPE